MGLEKKKKPLNDKSNLHYHLLIPVAVRLITKFHQNEQKISIAPTPFIVLMLKTEINI